MRKICFSLITMGVLLLTACTNDVQTDNEVTGVGTLKTTITFETKETAPRAASSAIPTVRATSASTAIPTVSWANVKQVQLFLYNSTSGKVAFSRTINPSNAQQTFSWTNVPAGTYRVALLANVKSTTDNIATMVGSGFTSGEFTDVNVIGNDFNTKLKIDLKTTALPALPIGSSPFSGGSWSGITGYLPPSEIFTAYSENVIITANAETALTGLDAMVLKREISLLRARVNKEGLPLPQRNQVIFNDSHCFIAVQRLPVGFGLKADTFAGGIMDTPTPTSAYPSSTDNSDVKRVLVGASGTGTYKTTDPGSGYDPSGTGSIIKEGFTMWNDIQVLPNASENERSTLNLTNSSDAPNNRKYFIIISAWVPSGYQFSNDPDTGAARFAATDQPVYWYGNIPGVFTKNVIRDVNLTLLTAGDPGFPPDPTLEGGLKIEVGAPEPWLSAIEISNIDM